METAPNESAYLKLTMKGSEDELNEIKTMLEEFLTGRDFRVVVFPKFMKKGPKNRKKGPKNGTEATEGGQGPNDRPKKRRNQRFKVRKGQMKQQDGGNNEQQGGFRPKKRRNPRPTEPQQQQPLGQTRTRMRRRPKHPKSAIQQQQPPRQQQQQPRQQNQRPQQQQRNPQSGGRRQRQGQRKGFRQPQSQQPPQAQSWGPPPSGGGEKRAKGKGNPSNSHFQLKSGGRPTAPPRGSVMKPLSKKFKSNRSRGGKGGRTVPAF